MKKILFFIAALICACSCYSVVRIEDEGLKWGYYSDVYVLNDSINYYINCTVARDRAEFQCSERKRRLIGTDTVYTSFGNYVEKHDTVTTKSASAVLSAKEFTNMLKTERRENADSPTIDIGRGVFITRKLFNEIYDNYIVN